MASRNMEQIAATAKIPDRYQLMVSELESLFDTASKGKEGVFNAITKAFSYGFVLGQREQKAKENRRKV